MSIQLENYGNNTFVLISFLFTLMKENHKKVNFSVYSEIIFMIINFRVRREEDKLIKIIKNHMWWRNHPFIKIKPSNIRKESMPTLSLSLSYSPYIKNFIFYWLYVYTKDCNSWHNLRKKYSLLYTNNNLFRISTKCNIIGFLSWSSHVVFWCRHYLFISCDDIFLYKIFIFLEFEW